MIRVRIYYDREGDLLEVLFSDEAWFMRETHHDDVMERVSRHDKEKPLVANLV
ncbi:MAG: DUF2283 domain-containing protein [Nitrospinales bacterium]